MQQLIGPTTEAKRNPTVLFKNEAAPFFKKKKTVFNGKGFVTDSSASFHFFQSTEQQSCARRNRPVMTTTMAESPLMAPRWVDPTFGAAAGAL